MSQKIYMNICFHQFMRISYFFVLLFFSFSHEMFTQVNEISPIWEYTHLTESVKKDFYHGKKINYSKYHKWVFLSCENSDSLPNLLFLTSNGDFKKSIDIEILYSFLGPYKVNQSNINKYDMYSNHLNADIFPNMSQTIQVMRQDSLRFVFSVAGFNVNTNTLNYINGSLANSDFLPHTSLITKFFGTYFLLDTFSKAINNGITLITKVTVGLNNAEIIDSVVSFSYTTSQFPLLPYPMAARQDDTNSYFVLHAPDTLYRGTTDTAIRVTKHNKVNFELEEVYIPWQYSFLDRLPNYMNPWQKKFVPKSFAVSKSGYAIVGNAIDSLGKSVALIQYTPFGGPGSSTILGTVLADLSGCRVRDDGTVVAVGTKPNGIMGTNDYYLAIVKPSGNDRLQEFSWGGAFDDALADVTFVDNGDIVVSGNAGVNCYVARIATDNPTSVGEIPFSSTIGFAPNPASSQTLVRFAPTTDGIATAELYDMRGMKVKQLFSEPVQRGNEYTFPAPVSDVPNGVYTVIITNGITKHHQQLQVIR